MEKNKIKQYLDRIVKATIEGDIEWQPILEYDNSNYKSEEMSVYIQMALKFEYSIPYYEKSFFVVSEDACLAILTYDHESGKDGTITHICELIGTYDICSTVYKIPPYMDGGTNRLLNSILEYRKKNEKESKMIEFLKKFIPDED